MSYCKFTVECCGFFFSFCFGMDELYIELLAETAIADEDFICLDGL